MRSPDKIAASVGILLILSSGTALSQRWAVTDARGAGASTILGFEGAPGDQLPSAWTIQGSVALDREVVHSGNAAARIDLGGGDADVGPLPRPSSITLRIPVDFEGENIELRGYLRGENVVRRVQASMARQPLITPLEDPIEGTRDWTEFSVKQPIDPVAHTAAIGVSFSGAGTIWVDDLEVLVDGRLLSELPRIEKLTDDERDRLIARAERAGPGSVADEATIKTVFAGAIRTLREGTNSWTCWAETDGLGPMCNEPGWDDWLMAYWNDEELFSVDRISTSYMLAAEGERPHVMILVPDPAMLDGLSTISGDPIWAMWTDRPFAHIMLNTGDEAGPIAAASGFGFRRTIFLRLPPQPFIPFEPVEIPEDELERYSGSYAPTSLPPALASRIPEDELEEEFESYVEDAIISLSIEGGELTFIALGGAFSQRFLPASDTRFVSGQDEILFEIDGNGRVTGFSRDEMRFERIE